MAIQLEFCNIIVPVAKIKEKLGLDVFEEQYSMNSDTTWNDGLLWRTGCMDNSVLSDLLDGWEALGFDLIEEVGSKKQWKDLCVVNSNFGPSYPCNWIEYSKETNTAWLKGEEPGSLIGPEGRDIHWTP